MLGDACKRACNHINMQRIGAAERLVIDLGLDDLRSARRFRVRRWDLDSHCVRLH